MKSPLRLIPSLLAAPLLLVAAGCASNSTDPKTAKAEPAEEYITYTVTGSNIPKRIKKSDVEKGNLPKDMDATLVDKDEFQKSLRPGTAKGN